MLLNTQEPNQPPPNVPGAQINEVYIRNFILDIGQCPGNIQKSFQVDQFIAAANQTQFNLSVLPDTDYPVLVYQNGELREAGEDFTINSRTITFPSQNINTGDAIKCCYWIPAN